MGCLIVVDLETSGLRPETAGVWDVAAVALRDGAMVARFSSLVWPGREALRALHREVIERVSGFDVRRLLDEDVPDVPTARQLFREWLDHVSEAQPPRLTSYNAEFDRRFLTADPWSLTDCEWAPCLMRAATAELGPRGVLAPNPYGDGWRWPKLAVACQHFVVPFAETHRALTDAEAAARIALILGVA